MITIKLTASDASLITMALTAKRNKDRRLADSLDNEGRGGLTGLLRAQAVQAERLIASIIEATEG